MKNKLSITEPRLNYKPFTYPELYEYYRESALSTWVGDSIPMSKDVHDFNHNCTQDEKDVIQNILKGFTIIETRIADYWGDVVTKRFPKFELIAVARAFAFEETNHQMAYSHLSDSLGLNDYDAFLEDKIVCQKLSQFIEAEDTLVSIATFSGVGEGIQLFSAFSVLLSFCRQNNRFSGIDAIVSYSAKEEDRHSNFGIQLFNLLVEEQGITKKQTDAIYKAFELGIQNEFFFIDQIFEGRVLKTINKEDLKDYILMRANAKLKEMNLEPIFEVEGKGYNISSWFNVLVFSQASQDFFSRVREGSTYSAIITQDFKNYDYTKTRLVKF
jgi:ribonucleoside-diphosphate reductase beta chain